MIEFNISGPSGPCGTRKGKPITLKAGKVSVNLVIQQPDGYLTHYETGWVLSTYGGRIKSKAAAIRLWKKIIENYGAEHVLARINSNPVINESVK